MTSRDDFAFLLRRNQRRMNAERRAFAEAVVSAMEAPGRDPGRPFDQLAYMQVSRALGPILDDYYGRWPGDRDARFWRLMVDDCRQARALAFQRSVQEVRQRLKGAPEVLTAIRTATDGD